MIVSYTVKMSPNGKTEHGLYRNLSLYGGYSIYITLYFIKEELLKCDLYLQVNLY